MSEEKVISNNSQSDPQPKEDGLFGQLVGEGKKFKDAEALAKGKAEADNYIEELKARLAAQEEALSQRPTIDEVRQIFSKEPEHTSTEPGTPAPVSVPREEIEAVLAEREYRQRAQSNLDKATSQMVEAFGDLAAAQKVIASKSQELGMPVDTLQNLAKESPSAFIRLMGLQDSPSSNSQPVKNRSQANPSVSTQSQGYETYEDFKRLRKENPKLYYSAKIQHQLHRKAAEKGRAFYTN